MTTDEKYSIDDYLKDKSAKKYESKAKRMIKIELEEEFTTDQGTLLPVGTIIVGKNKYDALKKIPSDSILKTQLAQITIFEESTSLATFW